MSLEELLRFVSEALRSADVPYMIVGSFASAVHGDPRSTMDIDLVIDPASVDLAALRAALTSTGMHLNDLEGEVAVRGMANLIDSETGWKVDLIVRKDRAFSVEELARRLPVDLLGVALFVATAEDTVLAKLEWAREGASERQIEDAAGILHVAGPDIDATYLDRWATELGITEQLQDARRRAAEQ